MRKEDSAFVYCVLEALEGAASYSTVDYRPGETHRDLILTVPESFVGEIDDLLSRPLSRGGLAEMVYDIKD